MKQAAISILILLISLSSCAMKQDVYLNASNGGRVVFDIRMAGYVTEVVEQLSVFVDEPLPEGGMPLFDTKAIEKDFQQREGIDLVSLESPTRNRLTGEFTFTDIESLLQEPIDAKADKPQHQLIRLDKQKNGTSLKVRIDRDTVNTLLADNPSFNNPLIENFGPTATEGLIEADYLDMMEFALGTESRKGYQGINTDTDYPCNRENYRSERRKTCRFQDGAFHYPHAVGTVAQFSPGVFFALQEPVAHMRYRLPSPGK